MLSKILFNNQLFIISTYVLFIRFSNRSRLNVSCEYILVVSCTYRLKFIIDVDLYTLTQNENFT